MRAAAAPTGPGAAGTTRSSETRRTSETSSATATGPGAQGTQRAQGAGAGASVGRDEPADIFKAGGDVEYDEAQVGRVGSLWPCGLLNCWWQAAWQQQGWVVDEELLNMAGWMAAGCIV
jgi:hypothetical protein